MIVLRGRARIVRAVTLTSDRQFISFVVSLIVESMSVPESLRVRVYICLLLLKSCPILC